MLININKISFVYVLSNILFVGICKEINNSNSVNTNKNDNNNSQEIWEKGLTDTYKIEGADHGTQKVNLKCGSESMHVTLETEQPFSGVMYTRGSFYKQTKPCFVKASNENSHSIEMNFNLDQCQTTKDGELYSNVVVIQNDPELITPGDSAFSLECDFRTPRSLDVKADMQTRDRIALGSKITLTSLDLSDTLSHIFIAHNRTIYKRNMDNIIPVTLETIHQQARNEL